MTASSLRLVVGAHEGAVAPALDLPVSEGSVLHVHLHLGDQAATVPATIKAQPPRRWWPRLLYLGATAVLVFVSYDVGTFAHRRAAYIPTSIAAAPGEAPAIPPALRAQLAQPPVVSPPPAVSAPGSAFGLHP